MLLLEKKYWDFYINDLYKESEYHKIVMCKMNREEYFRKYYEGLDHLFYEKNGLKK